MENIDIKPFYVGQEVVAIKNHSLGDFKKGDCFRVTSIYKVCCFTAITIGITPQQLGCHQTLMTCAKCGGDYRIYGECGYDATCFRPKLEISEFISMKEVASVELFAQN